MDELVSNYVLDNMENMAAISPRGRASWRVDPFPVSEDEFGKNFRVSKDLAEEIITLVQPLISTTEIDTKTKVLTTLNFLGTGSYQTPVGNNIYMNLSQPSVSRCIEEVTTALTHPSIFNTWVRFPRTFEELNRIAREFYDEYGFPGIVGAIDCTHVAIVPPSGILFDEPVFVNRKYFHSINTQLICGANLKVLNVNATFPGSCHDQHIWNNSNVLPIMEQIHAGGQRQYHLVGDSGYALRPWLLTPFADPAPGTAEFRYNSTFKKARACVERCNGVLKGRFRCLIKDRVLHYTPPKASKIINACVVLHNMCIERNEDQIEPLEEDDGYFLSEDNDPHSARTVQETAGRRHLYFARAKRDRLVHNVFNQ